MPHRAASRFFSMRSKFEAFFLNPFRGFGVGGCNQRPQNALRVVACELRFEFFPGTSLGAVRK